MVKKMRDREALGGRTDAARINFNPVREDLGCLHHESRLNPTFNFQLFLTMMVAGHGVAVFKASN
jgi:hypothetical protein